MKKIVVGISGASGMPLAVGLLKELKKCAQVETHLVYTDAAAITMKQECHASMKDLEVYADIVYDNQSLGASIASGTFPVDGMIVIPCSMKTVAGIRSGYTDNLLLRACDVMIKEQRKLILIARESPLSHIHLENLSFLSTIQNLMILPPMMTYYHQPKTIEDMEQQIIGKILAQFQIEVEGYKPWK